MHVTIIIKVTKHPRWIGATCVVSHLALARFQVAVHHSRTHNNVKYDVQSNGRVSIILCEVPKAAQGSGLCKRMCPSNLSQSKQVVPPRTPCSSGTGMWRKRKVFPIRSCFLTGSGEGSIISCYAKHLFYSMRTCDVSEPVSLVPLRHVSQCHEKSRHACPHTHVSLSEKY